MLRNYLITTLRNNMRNPSYFFINVAGLATGITSCLLISFYILHELSYDRFHSRLDRLYRVNYDVVMGGTQTISPSVPVFVGPYLNRLFPEVEESTRILNTPNPITIHSTADKMFDEKEFIYADSNFFRVLDFKAVSGDLSSALRRPKTLVITRSVARKYFGKENAVGKTLEIRTSQFIRAMNSKKPVNIPHEVTAVIEDVPSNSHFTFDFISSIYSRDGIDDETIQWNNPNFSTLILVRPGSDRTSLQSRINDWVNPPGERRTTDNSITLELEPLSEVHFNTQVFNFRGSLAVTDRNYLYIFGTVACLMLLIACINYVNLATARAATRAKEVGIRKTSGADTKGLVVQFMSESFVLLLPSILLSLLATELLLPVLNAVSGKQMVSTWSAGNLLGLTIAWVLLSILSGFYPAVVLSRFKPVSILKGKVSGAGNLSIRHGLVITQFVISSTLITGTLVVIAQLRFMQDKKLGIDKEHVVFIRGNGELFPRMASFKAELRSLPGVEAVSGTTMRSPFETVVGNGLDLTPNTTDDDWITVGGIGADEEYVKVLGLELVAGRNLDPVKMKDTINEFIVNEAFLRDFGWSQEEAVGREVNLGLTGTGKVVGVIADFHIASLHEAVRPVVIYNRDNNFGALVRIAPGNTSVVIERVEAKWKNFVPERPFNFTFLDQQYDAMYRTEQRVGQLAGIFAGVAVLVACLGLLGLASFTSLQRAKEISIRKVLGASVSNIVWLLSSGYLRLIVIAFTAAVPASYLLLQKWLENFAFSVGIGPIYFAASLIILFLVAMLTIGYQSFRASVANPVDNLRME